jgi:8-oxo-dGTP pyrophosphatase MutT (NUDIX family)
MICRVSVFQSSEKPRILFTILRCFLEIDIIKPMLRYSRDQIKAAVDVYQMKQQARYAEIFTLKEIKRLRPSAVLIPLLKYEGHWHVLLTQRSQNLVEHRGQVAFPGGARERGDADLQTTALREMHEEIGIAPADVDLYGYLGDMPVITGYMVRVFVGEIPWPYDLVINADEVESAFIIPLDWLLDPVHRTVQYRSYAGREIPVIYFDHFEGHQLWGASAEMTLALLEALQSIQ